MTPRRYPWNEEEAEIRTGCVLAVLIVGAVLVFIASCLTTALPASPLPPAHPVVEQVWMPDHSIDGADGFIWKGDHWDACRPYRHTPVSSPDHSLDLPFGLAIVLAGLLWRNQQQEKTP